MFCGFCEKKTQDFEELISRYPSLSVCREDIEGALILLRDTFRRGGKVLTCGNGGSASDALHIVGELMKGFRLPRRLPDEEKALLESLPDGAYIAANLQGALPALSLVGETALSTAYANDEAPDLSFAQQVWGQGREGDLLWGISTSGNSKNVLFAAQTARAKGMKVLSLTGESGGKLKGLSDLTVAVPEKETYRVQELHLPVYHALCLALEEEFFG